MNLTLKSRINLFLLLLFLAPMACNREEAAPDCGCHGTSFRLIEDAPADYMGDGLFSFQDFANSNTSYSAATLCDTTTADPDWVKGRNNYRFRISGQLKDTCPLFPGSIPFIPSYKFIPSKIEQL